MTLRAPATWSSGDLGARLWAERAHRELERVGLRRPSGDDLSPSERRVAELAAAGMKKVAAALFISPKTVEANLVRIYRKLGIATRAELGARMADGRLPSGSSTLS